MTSFRHLRLLMWKNFLIQWRHPWVTFFEIVIPCLFVVMVGLIRIQVAVVNHTNNTEYDTFSVFGYIVPPPGIRTLSIHYSPNTDPKYGLIMDEVVHDMGIDFEAKGFPTEEDVVADYLRGNTVTANTSMLCAVIFDPNANLSSELKFKLRFKSSPLNQESEGLVKSWRTKLTFPPFSSPGPRSNFSTMGANPGYYEEGFVAVQHLVAKAVLTLDEHNIPKEKLDSVEVIAQRYPYPPYIEDDFLLALQFLFPMILMFSFIYPAVNQTKNIVLEKEKRLKESMKMMGLRDWLHWTGWFLKSFLWLAITVAIMTVVLSVSLKNGVGILNKSNGFLIFIFLILYSMTTICFSFMLSTLFSQANVAGIASGVIFFVSFFPYIPTAQNYLELPLTQKLGLGVLHNCNMAYGAMIIVMWEGTNVGVQWNNFAQIASPDDNHTLLYVMVMFVFDSALYLIITWYVSSVFPGEFGLPLKFYFPFTKSYWCGDKRPDIRGQINVGFDSTDDEINGKKGLVYLEKEPLGLAKGIQIKGLSKTFDGGDTYAVSNLNLSTYFGQITALLGHNGAGKTTTMSILTGLFPPSSGTAIVNGFDIRTNIEQIRSSLGICPQFDVLFDELTVEEHLKFYCQLKNVTDAKEVEEEIISMVELLALEDKLKAQSHTLSGGMKRKLSVGMALIGHSKIVILDEPTSGMDVSARRFIWDLLSELKEDRCILLSTHFMEEADVLGDRIAIMANGKLQCCGSPLFLKKKYGAGYHLTITKNERTDVSKITGLIQSYIPNAKLDTGAGTELAYSLPDEDSAKFEGLFADIEDSSKSLGIDSFGASITTMEEVFLKVGEYAEEGIKAINESQKINGFHETNGQSIVPFDSIDGETKPQTDVRNRGITLLWQQFCGLVIKKLLFSLRNPFLTFSQLILPVLLMTGSIIITRTMPAPSDAPALKLDLDNFKGSKVSYFRDPTQSGLNPLIEHYSQLLTGPNVGDFQEVNLIEDNVGPVIVIRPNGAVNDYLIQRAKHDMDEYTHHMPIGAAFVSSRARQQNQGLRRPQPEERLTTVTALFNNQAYHTPAISMAFVDNAIIRYMLNRSDYRLDVTNHPMPRDVSEILLERQVNTRNQFQIAQSLMFAMSFLSASFVVLLVRELSIKGKHLQTVCGVKLSIFWLSSYVVDFITYFIPCLLIMLVFVVTDEKELASGPQQARILLLFFIHGLAMLPFIYVLSFLFSVPSTAYVRICLYTVIITIGALLAVMITEMPALKIVKYSKVVNTLASMFLPNYGLGRSMYNLYNNFIGNQVCNTHLEFTLGSQTINITISEVCKLDWVKPDSDSPLINAFITCCKGKCKENCFPWEENYLSLESPGIGMILIWLSVQVLVYWLIVILIEYNVFRNIKYFFVNLRSKGKTSNDDSNDSQSADVNLSDGLDEDVVREKERLREGDFSQLLSKNALVIKDLTKNYGSFRAVDNISYGVRKGECFGLLGINGAGKTTTFKMITGDEPITSGDIFVNGFNVKQNIQTVQQQIGYCPQFDGLLDQMTARETLTLFSRLRGIQEGMIPALITQISGLLYFDMHLDKRVGQCSGGTKRKLSTAVALLGSPPVSFLDEPTTGVDPVARRCLWDALSKRLSEGTSIVLTSHSMEECEALCHRLIIMVNGRICCIGSPQHLKNKFGKGYTVHIKVAATGGQGGLTRHLSRQLSRQKSRRDSKKRRTSSDAGVQKIVFNRQTSEMALSNNTSEVKEFMEKAFPGCQLKAVHSNQLEYSICDDSLKWSEIFGRIERSKHTVNIEDYSIGQTSLEQIFLSFARKQREVKV